MGFSQCVSRISFPVALLLTSGFLQVNLAAQTAAQAPAPATPQQPGELPAKDQPGVPAPGKTAEGEDKRVFGVLPNYRTAEMSAEVHPLTPKQKLKIATKDSFDYPLVILGGAYAALYQLENNHPEFGQGAKGYFSRFGTSYSDQVIGNMMTEAFMPILFKEDPRYFRKAEGSKMSRTGYALSRIFVTRTDAGKASFNYSEVLGNGIASAIGLSYYPDNRDVPDYLQNWGIQLGTDATSQVLKEFWPDVKRWWHTRHDKGEQP
ncbi:MAG: hypothetical protein WB992_18435 [Bryobacteraceae bacterium]